MDQHDWVDHGNGQKCVTCGCTRIVDGSAGATHCWFYAVWRCGEWSRPHLLNALEVPPCEPARAEPPAAQLPEWAIP